MWRAHWILLKHTKSVAWASLLPVYNVAFMIIPSHQMEKEAWQWPGKFICGFSQSNDLENVVSFAKVRFRASNSSAIPCWFASPTRTHNQCWWTPSYHREKLRAVIEAPTPRDVQELRSFLGLINYGNFIRNLSILWTGYSSLTENGTEHLSVHELSKLQKSS